MSKFIFLFLLSFNCLADENWTRADSYREAVYLTLHAIDWNQTLQIKDHSNLQESNPQLGAHPSAQRINQYMAESALLQFGIAYVLPEKYRAPFQYITVGDSLHSVSINWSLGLRVKF